MKMFNLVLSLRYRVLFGMEAVNMCRFHGEMIRNHLSTVAQVPVKIEVGEEFALLWNMFKDRNTEYLTLELVDCPPESVRCKNGVLEINPNCDQLLILAARVILKELLNKEYLRGLGEHRPY